MILAIDKVNQNFSIQLKNMQDSLNTVNSNLFVMGMSLHQTMNNNSMQIANIVNTNAYAVVNSNNMIGQTIGQVMEQNKYLNQQLSDLNEKIDRKGIEA